MTARNGSFRFFASSALLAHSLPDQDDAGDVLAHHASLEADVCIRPDVALFAWREYRSAVDIIHAGRQAGRASIAQIKQQLQVPVD